MEKNLIKIGSITLLIFFALGIYLWQGIFLPKSEIKREKFFSVEKGDSLFEIGEKLERENLIKSKFFFDFYVLFKRKERNLKAGTYILSPTMSVSEIAQKIINGETAKVKITFPEGLTKKEIEKRLSEKLKRKISLNFLIKDFKSEFEFLKNAPDNASLEGFLFPDTYYFDFSATEKEIVEKFLKNFDKKLTKDLRQEIEAQGKKIFEILIMASLIEKEVYNTKECPDCKNLVSGILWKRLKSGMLLQVDATITYITGKKTTKISIEETQIDSPYNTYKYLGLPPGPICNPGLESILAALYPKESDYWYYLSTLSGQVIFSKSLLEHNLAKVKYLR